METWVVQDGSFTVLMQDKGVLDFKIRILKLRIWPGLLKLLPHCVLLTILRKSEKVYSGAVKTIFPVNVFLLKHSKIISEKIPPTWLLFVCCIFLGVYYAEHSVFPAKGFWCKLSGF